MTSKTISGRRRSGRTCSVCRNKSRRKIDFAILSGTPLRDIAGRFAVSKSALARHKPHIQSAIERAAAKLKADGAVDAAEVLRRLTVLGIQDPRRLFNEQGAFKEINELDAETAATIAGLDFVNLYEGEGDQKHCFGQLRKVRLVNPVAPLTKLGEHLGLFQVANPAGGEVRITVHYGSPDRRRLEAKPEPPAIDVTPQANVVIRRVRAQLPEPAGAKPGNEPEGEARPTPPPQPQRAAPETGGLVRPAARPMFDFKNERF